MEPGVGAGRGDCLGTLLGPEESGAGPDGCSGAMLVGLLFLDFWIVDASIARTSSPRWVLRLFVGTVVGVVDVWVFVFVVCVFAVLMMVPLLAAVPVKGLCGWWCCCFC